MTPEEIAIEQQQIRAFLKELLTPQERWDWPLFYNYILSTFQGRGHSKGRIKFEVYDTSVREPVKGNEACFHIIENTIYINRHVLKEVQNGQVVRVDNHFTTDNLIAVLLEEIFHADAEILRPREDRTNAGLGALRDTRSLGARGLLGALAGQGMEQIKEIARQQMVARLHDQSVQVRQLIRNWEIRQLMGDAFREQFYGRRLTDEEGSLDIEHENVFNLIAHWLTGWKRGSLTPQELRTYVEVLSSPKYEVRVRMSGSAFQLKPIRIVQGEVLAADLSLKREGDTYQILGLSELPSIIRSGNVRVVQRDQRTEYIFDFSLTEFRESSDVITALVNFIRMNHSPRLTGEIVVYVKDLTKQKKPFAIIHQDGRVVNKIFAQRLPADWSAPEGISTRPSASRRPIAYRLVEIVDTGPDEDQLTFEPIPSAPTSRSGDIDFEIASGLTDSPDALETRILRILERISSARPAAGRLGRNLETLQQAVSDLNRFRLVRSRQGAQYPVESSSFRNVLTIMVQNSARLSQLTDDDLGFLIINSLMRSDFLAWTADWIKGRVTTDPVSRDLFHYIFDNRPRRRTFHLPRLEKRGLDLFPFPSPVNSAL